MRLPPKRITVRASDNTNFTETFRQGEERTFDIGGLSAD